MASFCKILLLIFAAFIAILAMNSFVFLEDHQLVQGVDFNPIEPIPRDVAVHKIQEMVRFPTVSDERVDGPKWNYTAFLEMHKYLEKAFPLVHKHLKLEKINKYSLLYTWEGSDPSLKPLIFLAHQDVVPVEENDWKYPAFEGWIMDGTLYGRGSIDTKASVGNTLDAAEALLEQNFQPKRTIYLAFGHDEEVLGLNGAKKIVELLVSRNVQAEAVIDEGGVITKGILDGVQGDLPVAMVGIGEKGFLNLNLTLSMQGGHSSMPRSGENPIAVLSSAIHRLMNNPMPPALSEASHATFNYLAAHMGTPQRIIMSNPLLEPLLKVILSMKPSSNALMRTTISPTIIRSGLKTNVIPQKAYCNINFRIRHGETIKSVTDHVRRVIADDRVSIEFDGGSNPSAISPTDSVAFQTLHRTIREYFPDCLVAPYLVVGGTDSKHYEPLTKNIYRFTPAVLNDNALKKIHGIDEQLSVDDIERGVSFYMQLMRNWDVMKTE